MARLMWVLAVAGLTTRRSANSSALSWPSRWGWAPFSSAAGP